MLIITMLTRWWRTTGGTAGCIVAGRLAKADPSLEILVVEEGIGTKNNPIVIHPALFPANQAPSAKTVTFYESKPSKHLADRKVVVPTGGCMGGGSSVNFLMYTRGQAIDYDDWDTEGWSARDLVPLLRKASGRLGRKCNVSGQRILMCAFCTDREIPHWAP
jgi:alcohol oxidase